MIDATDFARLPPDGAIDDRGAFPFGASRERAVAALRRLADDVEAGRTLLAAVHVVGKAPNDDFTEKRLILKLHERMAP